jgi:hypothetical protein
VTWQRERLFGEVVEGEMPNHSHPISGGNTCVTNDKKRQSRFWNWRF